MLKNKNEELHTRKQGFSSSSSPILSLHTSFTAFREQNTSLEM